MFDNQNDNNPSVADDGWLVVDEDGKHHFFTAGKSLCGQYVLEPEDGTLQKYHRPPVCILCMTLRWDL